MSDREKMKAFWMEEKIRPPEGATVLSGSLRFRASDAEIFAENAWGDVLLALAWQLREREREDG